MISAAKTTGAGRLSRSARDSLIQKISMLVSSRGGMSFSTSNFRQRPSGFSGDHGLTVVSFGQGFRDMSPPIKELMKLVLEKQIVHSVYPLLLWMMDNIYIRTDPAGNIKADKEKNTKNRWRDRHHYWV